MLWVGELHAGEGLIKSRSSLLGKNYWAKRSICSVKISRQPSKAKKASLEERACGEIQLPLSNGEGKTEAGLLQAQEKKVLRMLVTNWEVPLCGPTYLKQEIECLPPHSLCWCKAVKAQPGLCTLWLLMKTWLLVRKTVTTHHRKSWWV